MISSTLPGVTILTEWVNSLGRPLRHRGVEVSEGAIDGLLKRIWGLVNFGRRRGACGVMAQAVTSMAIKTAAKTPAGACGRTLSMLFDVRSLQGA
jgi:hypothetical protein